MTEITEIKNREPLVLYDSFCPFCTTWVQRFRSVLQSRGFRCVTLQEFCSAYPDVHIDKPYKEMIVRTSEGTLLGGADAVIHIARLIWWALPLVAFSKFPFGIHILRKTYRWVAARRRCLDGTCEWDTSDDVASLSPLDVRDESREKFPINVSWVLVAFVISGAIALRPILPPWGFMWVMTAALFLGFKCILFLRARLQGLRSGVVRSVGYFIAWPGMDIENYFTQQSQTVPLGQMGKALAKLAGGALLFWLVARWLPSDASLVKGWIGMTGLVLMLHCGLADLLAIAWKVKPIMNAPLGARSVSDFWGSRWNIAFSQMAQILIVQPLRKRFGVRVTALCVFAVSGLLHELVISVPARGGYGYPTSYFLIQGTGLLIDRHFWGSKQTHYAARILFAWIIVAGPVFWLFHPLFIERVIVPMMYAWGAL